MSRRPVGEEPPAHELPPVPGVRAAMLRWLDRLPWTWLLLLGTWLTIAPITPEPHLIEKLRMLAEGALVRPLDIFDLAMHATPLLLVALKLRRQSRASRHLR